MPGVAKLLIFRIFEHIFCMKTTFCKGFSWKKDDFKRPAEVRRGPQSPAEARWRPQMLTSGQIINGRCQIILIFTRQIRQIPQRPAGVRKRSDVAVMRITPLRLALIAKCHFRVFLFLEVSILCGLLGVLLCGSAAGVLYRGTGLAL